ncbi:MAG TPA: chemotaxis protein CheW [Desulfuromonadaceae bacterium]|jgi:chemotaxis signal transduction protein
MDQPEKRYLIFTLAGERFALDLAYVAEVDEPLPAWPIPGAPEYYDGAINFHDNIVAVMNLSAFLGLPQSDRHEKLVVLTARVAALAFLVERVERIIPAEQVIKDEHVQQKSRFGITNLTFNGGSALLLDAQGIVTAASELIQV